MLRIDNFWRRHMAITNPTGMRAGGRLIFGLVAVAIVLVVTVGGYYAWHRYKQPSQASVADCELAQTIIDQAQKLPRDKAAVETWLKETRQIRISRMADGYLGAQISGYEHWAASRATGEGELPTREQMARMTKEAKSHCAGTRPLVIPPITS
jgi:hypothetical protein